MNTQANKRAHSSSTSEFESNTSTLDQSVFTVSPSPTKKQVKKKTKKIAQTNTQRNIDELDSSLDTDCTSQKSTMEKKLDQINEKLSKMLTKDDKVFIKEIIKSTIEERKEHILQSVTRRIENLEGEVHQVCVESDKFKELLNEKNKEIEQLKEKNTQLLSHLKAEESVREKEINELEQYGRRNNVRISGILDDSDKPQSAATARLVIARLNKEESLKLDEKDIDIAHRLGKWESGKNRPVIVKFVRRQTKIEIMQSAKELRKKGLS